MDNNSKYHQLDAECEQASNIKLMESLREGLSIDKNFIVYKAFYVIFFAGFGAGFPYLSLYFKQLGLNASLVGILAGIRPMILFISGPFWSMVADRFKARKTILLLSMVAWLVMTSALVIPKPRNSLCKRILPSGKNFTIFRSLVTHEQSIPQNLTFKTPLLQNHSSGFNSQLEDPNNKGSYVLVQDPLELHRVFICLLFLVVIGEFLEAPSFVMVDTALLQKLGTEKRKHYGKTRLFGGLGYASASFLVGLLLDTTKYHHCGREMNDYNVLFCSFVIVTIVAFAFAVWLFEFTYEEIDGDKSSDTKSILKELRKIHFAFTILLTALLGFLSGLLLNFLNWYLEDLGASKTLMGIAACFKAVALIIAYTLNSFLTDLFEPIHILMATTAGYVILFGGFAVIRDPWWALLLESLAGMTYGTVWSTLVTHLAGATSKQRAATMQGK